MSSPTFLYPKRTAPRWLFQRDEPAAGRATRLGRRRGPSKEILAVAADAEDVPARIACQDLLDNFRMAGVNRVLVLLRSGKWDVARRLGDGSEFGVERPARHADQITSTPANANHFVATKPAHTTRARRPREVSAGPSR